MFAKLYGYTRMHSFRLMGVAVALALAPCTQARADSFFVDPSHYDLYNCDQLAKARKNMGARVAELQGLMAKAETGFAGALMSGLAYQSDYLAARGELELIDQKREQNKCGPLPVDVPAKPATPEPKSKHRRH